MRLRIDKVGNYAAVLISLLIIVIILFLFFGRIDETITVYGKVVPKEIYNVYSPKDGFIEKIYFKDGDSVKTGDTLFAIVDPYEEIKYKKLCLELETKKRELLQLESNLQILRKGSFETQTSRELVPQTASRYREAKRKYEIAQALYEKQYISTDEFNEIETNYQLCATTYEVSQQEANLKEKIYESCINQKKREIDLLQTETSTLKRYITSTFVLSPISGIVSAINNNSLIGRDIAAANKKVSCGQMLGYVLNVESLHVVGKVPESHIFQIKPGQIARIYLTANQGNRVKPFEGKVTDLKSTSATEVPGEIHIRLKSKPSEQNLMAGLSARIKIIVETNKRIIERLLNFNIKQGG